MTEMVVNLVCVGVGVLGGIALYAIRRYRKAERDRDEAIRIGRQAVQGFMAAVKQRDIERGTWNIQKGH